MHNCSGIGVVNTSQKNEVFQSDLTSTLNESCVPGEISVISGYPILVKVIRETAHMPLWISLWVSSGYPFTQLCQEIFQKEVAMMLRGLLTDGSVLAILTSS